jgi:hypothetical protein
MTDALRAGRRGRDHGRRRLGYSPSTDPQFVSPPGPDTIRGFSDLTLEPARIVYYEEGSGSSIRGKRFRATKAGIERLTF